MGDRIDQAGVHTLVPRSAAPDDTVIAALERALEKARSGELRSIAMAGTTRGHGVFSSWEGDDFLALLGSLDLMRARVLAGAGILVEPDVGTCDDDA